MTRHTVVAAAILLAAAFFFRFMMVGYGFLALVLCAFAAAVVLLAVLPAPLKTLLCILMALWFIVFLAAEVCVLQEAGGRDNENADYLIVLGARVEGTQPSKSLHYRLEAAAEYLAAHPDCKAVLSGGQGPDEAISEAECMYRWLADAGIEPSRLLLEDRSTNTAENLMNSAALIAAQEGHPLGDTAGAAGSGRPREPKIVVCSAEYHLCRARLLSRKILGIDPGTLPAPTPRPVLRLCYFMREACGLMVQDLYL